MAKAKDKESETWRHLQHWNNLDRKSKKFNGKTKREWEECKRCLLKYTLSIRSV